MMAIALAMAERGLGRTAPNPSVGAVVVDEATGEVIARGWTQPGGRPHAETEAIRRAGPRARGATMYVTLEPCSHHGRTAPCAEAIIAAGLKRVVCAILDPDPRVSGRGLRLLRDAGIAVTRGVLAERAHWLGRGHIQRVTERRPLVQLKMALDRDGSIARGTGAAPVWVTGPQARSHGHLLRARADAIMVGAGTVRDDDPELTCRLPGLGHRSPIRIVLAGTELPAPGGRLARTARDVPVWVFCSPASDIEARHALEARGCRVIPIQAIDGRPWLPAVLEALVAEGVTRLLVEGGRTLWRAFLASGLADEVVCYRALPDGLAAGRAASTRDLAALHPTHDFAVVDAREVGGDGLFVFRRRKGAPMFTGIISDIGEVVARQGGQFTIRSSYPAASIGVGASIGCDGVCLTATSIRNDAGGSQFTVDVSNETRSKSTLDTWQPGRRVNLERALRAGDELGGHIVSGHVDGIARIVDICADGDSRRFTFEVPEHLAMYIAAKGSVALDGTSLTVNEVSGTRFGINIIPHTLTMTTWGARKPGEPVNLEVDQLARYMARLLELRG